MNETEFIEIPNYINYKINRVGDIIGMRGKMLKPWKVKGYPMVELNHSGIAVHRLVALTFIPNLKGKPQVNHRNGIKTDNRVENLEWCTNQENQNHAVENDLKCTGTNHPSAKLNPEEVKNIRNLSEEGLSQRKIAKIYGVTHSTIGQLLRGKNWKNAQL